MPEKHGEWYDLSASETVSLHSGEIKLIPLGVSVEAPDGYYCHVVPRSSTCLKYGLLMANSVGIIEHDYCGDNDILQFPAYATRDITITKGTRLCQFRLVEQAPEIEFEVVEKMDRADRGGFGSTGV